MPDLSFPLLFFPQPKAADRNSQSGRVPKFRLPLRDRQSQRIAPRLKALQDAFEARRLTLQQTAPVENPELVLVFEIVGTVKDFANAVNKIPGLEWLLEWSEEQIPPDEDFYAEGNEQKLLSGRLFLVGSNLEALGQILALWRKFQQDPSAKFDRGLGRFRHVFEQLRDIRHWSLSDRLNNDVRQYWQDCVDLNSGLIRFEIEAWYFSSSEKNESAKSEIESLVQKLNGKILGHALISEIAYHGFLVELPSSAIADVLSGGTPDLMLSDRIMFFRRKAQSVTDETIDQEPIIEDGNPGIANEPPVVALLDGLPLQNHLLLTGRLDIDDPDGWEADYPAKDRVHGTAMASLIVHGELDGTEAPLVTRLYVRPVLRPESSTFLERRTEYTPDDILLIDLIHRAVKRICEGEGDQPAEAPSVRVINLSIGDAHRLFEREMTPWGRLLDWLAFRYSILFIVSAGNHLPDFTLETPRDTVSKLSADEQSALALAALASNSVDRRLLSPAEAINVLTIGALHYDLAKAPSIPGRFDLFLLNGLSPLSRIGHGYRRAIKPDILMPGGRILFREAYLADPAVSTLEAVITSRAPGQRVAAPPLNGQANNVTEYSRGTSNAAALASRAAARAHKVLETLRNEVPQAALAQYDALLIKALLIHGTSWGEWSRRLLALRPELTEHAEQKDFVARWLGYGFADTERAISCTAERATILAAGEIGDGEGLIYSAPLPPSLSGKKTWRRLTITLAWFSPINPSHQAYRRAKLWLTPPQDELRVKRTNSVHDKAAQRGTVQHEILEGEDAVAFGIDQRFECKINCAADAGKLPGRVPFALCVSLEVGVGSGIPIYQEIRDRIVPAVRIPASA